MMTCLSGFIKKNLARGGDLMILESLMLEGYKYPTTLSSISYLSIFSPSALHKVLGRLALCLFMRLDDEKKLRKNIQINCTSVLIFKLNLRE